MTDMKKLHKQARELLHAASKIDHYRRDLTSQEDQDRLDALNADLRAVLADKTAGDEACNAAMEPLHAHLKKIGGKIYPKTFFSDNIEVILVAAIVVIGIRSFFFQPFIIPTNSMYPTYSGMKERIYSAEEAPSAPRKVFNFLTLGARHHDLVATASGELSIQKARTQDNDSIAFYQVVKGRKWFGLLPAQFKEYTFFVGDTNWVCKFKGRL